MAYKLEGFVKKLNSPVIVSIDGIEQEYESGTVLAIQEFTKRYEIRSLSARDDKFVLELAEEIKNAPFNYIGEEALL